MTAWTSDTEPVGFVKKTDGQATVVRGEKQMDAEVGLDLLMGDTLVTGKSGGVGVTFIDNSMVSIGPDTEYSIEEFVFNPREEKLSFLSSVSKGTLQFVSGTMAKLKPEAVAVRTPEGTIGVRGTRFVIKVEE